MTWQAPDQEELGDDIMSSIDFDMTIKREPNPHGDRVPLVFSGKFLHYKCF